jgi:hypothetical protein
VDDGEHEIIVKSNVMRSDIFDCVILPKYKAKPALPIDLVKKQGPARKEHALLKLKGLYPDETRGVKPANNARSTAVEIKFCARDACDHATRM